MENSEIIPSDSDGEIIPLESIPENLSDWSEIDRRVDFIGNGGNIHTITNIKKMFFNLWLASKKNQKILIY